VSHHRISSSYTCSCHGANHHENHLILDFQPPTLWANKSLSFISWVASGILSWWWKRE
jgi:hypothetical protein